MMTRVKAKDLEYGKVYLNSMNNPVFCAGSGATEARVYLTSGNSFYTVRIDSEVLYGYEPALDNPSKALWILNRLSGRDIESLPPRMAAWVRCTIANLKNNEKIKEDEKRTIIEAVSSGEGISKFGISIGKRQIATGSRLVGNEIRSENKRTNIVKSKISSSVIAK